MVKCKICGNEYKSISSLAKHVKASHGITSEEYYCKYMGNIKGICFCGKPTKYRNMNKGYNVHCSSKCAYHDKDVKNKRESTNLDRFGVKNAVASSIVQDKVKRSLLKKYGVDSPAKIDGHSERYKNNFMEKYGVENPMHLDEVKSKVIDTNIKRYGVPHAIQNPDIFDKARKTTKERLGVEYPVQNNKCQEKRKYTSYLNYGVDCPSKSEKVKEKTKATNLSKYGVEYPIQNKEVFKKARESTLNNFGVEYPSQSPEVIKKRKQNNLSKYGVEHSVQRDNIKEKIKNTFIKLYGVDNPSKLDKTKEKIRQTNIEKYGIPYSFFNDSAIKRRKINSINRMNLKYAEKLNEYNCEFLHNVTGDRYSYKCHTCDEVMEEQWQFIVISRLNNNQTPCIKCLPKKKQFSFKEKEVSDFIKTIYSGNVIENTRDVINPQEIDIFIPDMNIGFEFNGLHYHNELHKSASYHLEKTEACESKGIQLIHIYEDDWVNKQSIVKSRIKSLLGKSSKIYARKCSIREIKNKISADFMEINHIQGTCPSKYRYGLYYNDELVSVMTFGNSRFEKGKIELLRFCNKVGYVIVGGASKLFNHFIKNHEFTEMVSYADRSWSIGSLYLTLGFEYNSKTSPNYYYVVNGIRENRIRYQKHKLVNQGFDKNKTEREIMFDRELYRIYDSGNLKFTYRQ